MSGMRQKIQYSLALEPAHQGETPVGGCQGTEPFAAKPAPQSPALAPTSCRCPSLTPSNRRVRDPYARWCGRGGTARCPPIPIHGTEETIDLTRRMVGLLVQLMLSRKVPDRRPCPQRDILSAFSRPRRHVKAWSLLSDSLIARAQRAVLPKHAGREPSCPFVGASTPRSCQHRAVSPRRIIVGEGRFQ